MIRHATPPPHRERLDILHAQLRARVGAYDPLDPDDEDDRMTCPTCENDGWDENPDGLSCTPDGKRCWDCGGAGLVRPPILVPDDYEIVLLRLEAVLEIDPLDQQALELGIRLSREGISSDYTGP